MIISNFDEKCTFVLSPQIDTAAAPVAGSAHVASRSQGANHQPTKINGSNINITNNNSSSNNSVILASAVTPASTRASRLSFGPLEPQERCPIEGGLPSILLSSPSPPPPDDRRCSRSLALPAPHSLKSVDDRGTNAPESSSCVVSGVNGMDTKTNDDRARGADTEKDLLTTSTASIEHACQLGGASLTLPPQRELFGSDSLDQKQQQQQLDDLAPIPFVRGSSNSKPDAAVFDFDVDEIDGLIGELVDEPEDQKKHEQSLAGRLCEQPKRQQHHLQEEQQLQHDTRRNEGGGGEEKHRGGDSQQKQQPQKNQPQKKQPQQQKQDKRSDEEDGGETSATAVPAAAAATSMGPAQAILADPVIQHAIGNAMAVASKTHFMTQEAYTHAAALAAQSQVNYFEYYTF